MKVVWLKRDLRLHDHEALFRSIATKEKVLLLYILEPSLQQDIHYSARHFNFIKEKAYTFIGRFFYIAKKVN